MAAPTLEDYENAGRDLQDLGKMVNGAADLGGTGTVTTREGTTFKTLAKVNAELNSSVSSVATAASLATGTTIPGHVTTVENAKNTALADMSTDVTTVENAKNTALTDIAADQAVITDAKATALADQGAIATLKTTATSDAAIIAGFVPASRTKDEELSRKALWQAKRQALLHRQAPATLVLSRNIWVLGDSVSGAVGSPVEFKNLLDAKIANNCAFTGYATGTTTLTVVSVQSGSLARDQAIGGNQNYRIVQQLTGTTGGAGTYELANTYSNGTAGAPVAMTSRFFAFRDGTAGTKTSEHLATMTAAPAWKKRADTIETSGSINDYAAAPVDREWAWSGSTKANMDAMQALLTDGATFFIFHVWSDNASQGLADVEYHVRAMRAAYGARFIDVRAEMVADVRYAGQTGPDDYGRRRLIMPISTFAGYGLTARNRNFGTIRSYNTGSPVPADYSDGQILDNQFNDTWAVKVGAAGSGTITSPLDTKHPGEWGHRLMDQLATDLINALNNRAAPFIPSGHKALIPSNIAAKSVCMTLPSIGSLARVVRADIIAGDDDGLFGIDRETLAVRRSSYGTLTEGFRPLVVEIEDSDGNTRQSDAHLYVGMPSTQVTPRFITMSAPVHCSGMTGNDVPSGTAFSLVIRGKLADRANLVYLLNAGTGGDSSRLYVKVETDGTLSLLGYDAAGTIIVNQKTQVQAQATAQGKPFRSIPSGNVEFTLFLNIDWAAGAVVAYINDDRFNWGSTGTTSGTATVGGVFSGDKVNWDYGYLVTPRGVETANQGMTNGGGFGFYAHRTASDGGIDWSVDANRRLFMNANGTAAYNAGARPEVAGKAWNMVPFNGRGLYDMLHGPQSGYELTRLGFNPWLMSN